jgi:hypothetical protein
MANIDELLEKVEGIVAELEELVDRTPGEQGAHLETALSHAGELEQSLRFALAAGR